MKNTQGYGSGGYCVCAKCGKKVPHRSGTPCKEERCPECNKVMLREGSVHHDKAEEVKQRKNDK